MEILEKHGATQGLITINSMKLLNELEDNMAKKFLCMVAPISLVLLTQAPPGFSTICRSDTGNPNFLPLFTKVHELSANYTEYLLESSNGCSRLSDEPLSWLFRIAQQVDHPAGTPNTSSKPNRSKIKRGLQGPRNLYQNSKEDAL